VILCAPLVIVAAACTSPAPSPPTCALASSSTTSPRTGPGEFELAPTTLAWVDLSPKVFDRRWVLPERRRAKGRDFLEAMRSLLRLQFDVTLEDGSRYRCFGDLVAASRGLAPGARDRWYEALEQAAPKLMAEQGGVLTQLLFDDHLLSSSWKPSKNHKRDGLLVAESWNMKGEGAPWDAIDVRPVMEQAATVLHADLASIKAVENDYRAYPDNVGADYEEIYPIANSYFVGSDAGRRPFSALTIQFRCDLPFPFSDYTTRLGILNTYDDAGVLQTDIYSTSKDFYWLAGRDVFLPVADSEGEDLAFLLVRHFGFDLDGVPDGPSNRREALRGSMGNLKRNSERLYGKRSTEQLTPRNGTDLLREVRVLGRK
jgi:hypothetical protein